jgi:hypothetical protein
LGARVAPFEYMAGGRAQLDAGEGIPHDVAKAQVLKRIGA